MSLISPFTLFKAVQNLRKRLHKVDVSAIKTSKMKKKKFNNIRQIPPDKSILKMKIIRANFVALAISA